MTRYDLIHLNQTLCKVMVENSIDIKDVQYLPLIEEYRQMNEAHHKMGYIICYLAEKYKMSVRGVYKVIGRLNKNIKIQ